MQQQGGGGAAGTHWTDPQSQWAGRAQYLVSPPTSRLLLQPARAADTGRYKCRVDFQLEQTSFQVVLLDRDEVTLTVSQLLDLTVVVPPDKPTVRRGSGRPSQPSPVHTDTSRHCKRGEPYAYISLDLCLYVRVSCMPTF